MINSARYGALLADSLKPAIHIKCWGLLLKKVLLLYDNAHPHMTRKTVETINQFGFEVLEHPAYHPDLMPSD